MDNSSNTVISIKTAPSNCGAGAGKKNLYTISGILNFEKPLTERVLEKKIVIENDDTSDEEEELKTPINPYYILSEETVSAEIKSSFLLLNIGIKIIRSPEVAKHYFNWKRKNDLEKIARFPTDGEFTKIIYESFKKFSLSISLTAEKFEEILATKNYENLENLLIACKRKIIARKDFFLKGTIKVQIKKFIEFLEIKSLEIKESKVIDYLKPCEKSGKLSADKNELAKIKETLSKSPEFHAPRTIARINSYKKEYDLKSAGSKKSLSVIAREISKEPIINEELIETLLWSFNKILIAEINVIDFKRPTLINATIHSYHDFIVEGEKIPVHKAALLFSHLRAKNLSAKRLIKNSISEKDFEGDELSRSFIFEPDSKIAVIENDSITTNGARTQMIMYPYNSTYNELKLKLKKYLISENISDSRFVTIIKDFIKTGILIKTIDDKELSNNFVKFTTNFTYHLFVTEPQRHPAALTHNIMAFELVAKDVITFEEAIDMLPMSDGKAVLVIRRLQQEFSQFLETPYFYDKNKTQIAEHIDSKEVKNFLTKEQHLINVFNLNFPDIDFCLSLNKLCYEYYGINTEPSDSVIEASASYFSFPLTAEKPFSKDKIKEEHKVLPEIIDDSEVPKTAFIEPPKPLGSKPSNTEILIEKSIMQFSPSTLTLADSIAPEANDIADTEDNIILTIIEQQLEVIKLAGESNCPLKSNDS